MKPVSEWDENFILGLPLGEFDWFEAKGRRALDLTLPGVNESHVRETLSKAVSAFANSGGGALIYGLRNPQAAQGKWLVDDGGVSVSIKGDTREWLETVIPNLVDFPLATFNVYIVLPSGPHSQIQPGQGLFVVDIPDSSAAPHQASDNRYYVRVAGRSRPIGHRLVADIMGRRQYPRIELSFEIEITTGYHKSSILEEAQPGMFRTLKIRATNTGRVYAQYVNSFIRLPVEIVSRYELELLDLETVEEDGRAYCEFYRENTIRDVVDVGVGLYHRNKYGPSRYDPILPGLSHTWWEIGLSETFPEVPADDLMIRWSTYADNAPASTGELQIKSVMVVDHRKA